MNYCIYLKGTDPELTFTSEEHIFPAGIGGIQKLPLGYVSNECNNHFSKMELKLMRHSFISLPRQFIGPGKRGSLSPKNATKSQISIMNDDNPALIGFGYISLGKPYPIPEIRVNITDGKCDFSADSSLGGLEQYDDFMDSLRNFDNKYALYINQNINKDTFILGLHDKKWHLGLSNKDLTSKVNTFVQKIIESHEQGKTDRQEAQRIKSQPKVSQTVMIDDADLRVCTKIAFNYLAFIKGREYVLNECFDPIRDWIVNGGENNFAQRLEPIKNNEPFSSIPLPEDSHRLILFNSGQRLLAYISFYGNQFGVQIHLCDRFEEIMQFEGFVCDWRNRREFKLLDYINSFD